jgi:hypothetical protein
MVVDFQYHYVPVELAKKRCLYSDKTTYLQEGGRRATTMHARLYDLDWQLKEMSEAWRRSATICFKTMTYRACWVAR